MPHSIEWERKAAKALGRLPKNVQQRIKDAVSALAETPRPDGVRKLKGELEGLYRIQVGRDYRVVYGIDDETATIIVEALGPREGIY